MSPHPRGLPRQIATGGDRYGAHRVVVPRGALPQPAWRLDADFTRIFGGEVLLDVETLNVDSASFAQMVEAAQGRERGEECGADGPRSIDDEVAHTILRTVADRGKLHNPVTGSGGMLLGQVLQVAPGRADASPLVPGDRIATLVSLSLTPLRIDAVRGVQRASAQVDVTGEAVLFASGALARLPADLPERVALAALDVAGAAPQVARFVQSGSVVVVLGAGGKSGVLCAAQARRTGGPSARVYGVEADARAAAELRALGLCDEVVVADARDPLSLRAALLRTTNGREADLTISCVSVADVEMAAILVTRDRGAVYFFAMSTSFTRAALGAEGVGKDVDLFIGNGYCRGHAEHTLGLLRIMPNVRGLFEARYG
jgi:L-erythro-3,5-diaminohexanoate dehydrogenase